MLERIFRWCLVLMPRAFRERFGGEMLETARALDANPPRGTWRRVRAVTDAVVTPLSIRLDLHEDARLAAPRRRTVPMEALMRDLTFAVRGLRRDPAFTTFCVVTLALGIGANAAMFGIADRLLLSGPDHVQDAGRVVRIYETTQPKGMRQFTTSGFGYVSYDVFRHGTQSFTELATYAVNSGILGTGTETRTMKMGYVTASLFPLLGVQPARGRFFTEAEDAVTGAALVAVISEGAWRSWFGGAEDVLGKTFVYNDQIFTVVGVAPHGFTGPQFEHVDAWAPGSLVGARVTANWTTSWNSQWLQIIGRMRPGVTMDQTGQDLTSAARRGYTGDDPLERQAALTVASLRAGPSGTESTDLRVLRWLTGVSALVLLIACANIANLLLARGVRRGRDIAIRAALGAGRFRLVRLLLMESVLLASLGAAIGLLVAFEVGAAARTVLFTSVEWPSSPVSPRILLASAVIAVITGLLIGVIPALRSTRANLSDALRTGIREGGGHRSRLRSALTIAQAALSVVLLIGAGLFVRSLWKAYTIDFGFDADRVTVVSSSRRSMAQFPEGPVRDAERLRRNRFYLDVLDRVRTVPGVERASMATGMPFGNRFTVRVRAADIEAIPPSIGGYPGLSAVGPDYFQTMGTPILRGRAFEPGEGAGTEPVAIVSQLMAGTVWPGQDALGKCLFLGDGTPGPPPQPPSCTRIVGIAGNTYRSRLLEDPVMHYYIPAGQESGFGGPVLLVRTRDDAGVAAVRQLLGSLDSSIMFVSTDTIRSQIDPQMRPWKLGASVFAVSGLLALVVSGIGVYSVMSYLIAGRRREIGVRLALGARTRDIVQLVFGGSVAMAVTGVALGELIALSLGGFAKPLLFLTSPHDPMVFVTVGVVLVGVAILATLGPARRARRVSAIEALRAE